MPQASLEVSQNFNGGQREAFATLNPNFNESRGYFYPKIEGYKPTSYETWAIRYLIEEWDYGYCETKPTFPDEESE